MTATGFQERLERAGVIEEAGSDRPFLLRDDHAWWVRGGRVDVFSVAAAGDGQGGARTHLFRVEAGGLVLGTGDAGGAALLGVGGVGTELVGLDRELLRALARDPQHAPALCALLDGWVEMVCEGITRGAVAAESVPVPAGGELRPAAGSRIRAGSRVGWVRHLEGHSLLLGRDGLKVNGTGFTPLSEKAWLQPAPHARVQVASTQDLVESGDPWAGLDQLHALLRRVAAQHGEQDAAAERDRIQQKARTARAAMRGAFTALVDTLNPTDRTLSGAAEPLASPGVEEEEPLFAACRRVGAAMHIQVRPLPRSADAAPSRDALGAMARGNRFRTRPVVLRGEWWTEECGPLFACMAEDKRPVALLPARRGRYTLYDPTQGTEAAVTAALAEQLAPVAHAFYRPFPDRPMGILDVVRFGLASSKRDVAMILAMGVAGGLLSLITPLATGALFNDIIPGAARPQLLQLTVVLLVIAVTNTMFSIASGTALVRLEVKMGGAVQAGVWDRLLSLPIPFFRPFNAGNLAQRAMGIDAIRQVLSGATVSALLGGLFSIFHFGLLFYYSPKLAAWAAVLVAIALSAALVGGALQTRWERQVTGVRNRLAGSVLQFLTSIAKLRVAAAESQAFVIWARQFGHQRQLQFRSRAVGNLLATFQASFPLVATLILYALALPLLSGGPGALRTGDFLAFMASFGICMGGLLSACGALVTAAMVVPLYEQARPILQAAPEVDVARSDPGVLTGEIDVEHLSFRYGADGPMVLRDIRVRIAAGQYVAFVGPSGSGKSTLFRLLLGFEQPDSGGIYYDGQELSGLDIQAVRRQIGVVLQNGRLMSGDLFTNIVGSSSATLDEAWEAAAMAGFDEDIRKMPMGMHTVVSEGGGTLSGGQRQRLMIARAIVQKPRVLFFDEATSALDNRTQAIVSESLERLRATRVVIAHRLSTILNADQIYVMQGGRVVQHGTYRELVEQEGLFAELARRQLA